MFTPFCGILASRKHVCRKEFLRSHILNLNLGMTICYKADEGLKLIPGGYTVK